MTSVQLARTVLSRLLESEAALPADDEVIPFGEFEKRFREKENVGLKSAIIQATGVSPFRPGIVPAFLGALPDVQFCSSDNGRDGIRVCATKLEAMLSNENREATDETIQEALSSVFSEPFRPESADRTDRAPSSGSCSTGTTIRSMTPSGLESVLRSHLSVFTAGCSLRGKQPSLSAFCQFFFNAHGLTLSQALRDAFGLSRTGSAPSRGLKRVPGVEVFKSNGMDCVRMSGNPGGEVFRSGTGTSERRKFDRKSIAGRMPAKKERKNALRNLFSTVPDGRANYLPSLAPCNSWTVLVDDTGSVFSVDATGRNKGRMVAVFVPRGTKLPDLSRHWHAVEIANNGRSDEVIDVLGRLIESDCGIVGIPVTVLPATSEKDRWFSCLEELLALSFRLLPLDGETVLSIFVEQHGAIDVSSGTKMVQKMVSGILDRLAEVFPRRAALIFPKIAIISKEGHPWNGYADAAAYAWGGKSLSGFRKCSRWVGPCFLEGDAASRVRRAMDALGRDRVPEETDWTALLSAPDAENGESLISAFLCALGQEAMADVGLWRTYLDETRRHLDSKAIRMELLGRQLRWLGKWHPADVALPPRTRLMWLVSELAGANHAGRTDLHTVEAFRKEIIDLCVRLFREDCPLVALANLHLAVARTNAFEFEKARDLLLPLRDWPVEGMGLRMRGRLLSSLGQHQAFLGDSAGALPFFDEALALFRDLSEDSFPETVQTSAYSATAAMDAGTPDADARLAAYLWGGAYSNERLAKEARSLALSTEPVDKYAHHVLLRRLVELPASHPARAAYLEEKDKWADPINEHPWELIEFYRALLLPEGEESLAHLRAAYEIALADSGPTLQVIAAVIQGASLWFGQDVGLTDYADLVACCSEALPALGEARLAALRGQLAPATRLDPLSLAKAVLPFNFR